MNFQMKIFLSLILFIVIACFTTTVAQDEAKPNSSKHEMKKMDCCKDKGSSEKSMNCKKEAETTTGSKINVDDIDKNKDGKIFQCPMCPDQYDNKSGKCSKCEMDLKELSLNDAQKALDKKPQGMTHYGKVDGNKMDHSKMMKHDMKQTDSAKMEAKKEKIVREGEIDLAAIDKNGDKKVYQDQMDWNVISDLPGKCPLCKMTLKEVSINEAKKNLLDHGFKVK